VSSSHSISRLFAGTLAACVACASASTAAPRFPDAEPPSAMRVHVGRQWIGTHDVTLRGDTLVVAFEPMMGSERPSVTRVVPTADAWREFWRAAEGAGVRAWPRECRNPGIVDGGGFTLELAYGGERIEASGVNAFPRRDGSCRTDGVHSDELRDFLAAVSRLIGRQFP
jgi:hypothetical protein